MLSTNLNYKTIVRSMDKSLAQIASAPDTKRESEYYLKNIGNIKSIDGFLSNDRVYRFAMKAFGLGDMIYAKAFVKKILTEGNDSAQSFSNQLADPRFKEFVATFNFKAYGTATTSFDRTQKPVVDKFLQQKLEENAGKSDEGVRLALYFKRKASSVTSAYSILADPALLKVAQVALNLPAIGSSASIELQASLISDKIDIENLDNPNVLDKFLTRFTTMWDLKQNTSSSTVPALVIGQGTQSITTIDTLLKIQSLTRNSR